MKVRIETSAHPHSNSHAAEKSMGFGPGASSVTRNSEPRCVERNIGATKPIAEHGLAGVCHAESAAALRGFLLMKPERTTQNGEMDSFARLLAMSFDGRRTILSLLPPGAERPNALRAVHDLVRLGFIAIDRASAICGP